MRLGLCFWANAKSCKPRCGIPRDATRPTCSLTKTCQKKLVKKKCVLGGDFFFSTIMQDKVFSTSNCEHVMLIYFQKHLCVLAEIVRRPDNGESGRLHMHTILIKKNSWINAFYFFLQLMRKTGRGYHMICTWRLHAPERVWPLASRERITGPLLQEGDHQQHRHQLISSSSRSSSPLKSWSPSSS